MTNPTLAQIETRTQANRTLTRARVERLLRTCARPVMASRAGKRIWQMAERTDSRTLYALADGLYEHALATRFRQIRSEQADRHERAAADYFARAIGGVL